MSAPFPTLDALRPHLPKPRTSTDWVGHLAVASTPVKPAAQGWTPDPLKNAVAETVDPEAIRAAAEAEGREAGFRTGYAEGLRAGNELGLAEGRRTGREEARAEGLAEEAATLGLFREALQQTAGDLEGALARWREEIENRAAEMAMDCVKALLAHELATSRPDAIGIVREALGFAEGAERATIRLAPFDRAALAERKEEILAACAGLREVELVDDRSIEGGCRIETEQGVVDATLATRLALMEAA